MLQSDVVQDIGEDDIKDVEGQIRLAMSLCEQRRTEEADLLLLSLLREHPLDRQLLWSSVFVAQLRRNWPETLTRCESLLAHFPDNARGLEVRVTALRELQRFEDAEKALVVAREYAGDSLPLDIEAARLASARSDWDTAIAAWEYVRTRNPDSPDAVIEISDILVNQKKFVEADRLLQEQLERFPDSKALAIRHGFIMNKQKFWSEALTRWSALEQRFPDDTQILSGKAEALWMLRDEAALVPLLDRMLALQPHQITAEILYARLEMRQNRAADAVARLVKAEACWPGNRGLNAQLNDARMQALMSVDDVTSVASAGSTRRDAGSDQGNLFSQFESLGNGCEFGLLQRRFGAEPLGLFRWANITPRGLTEAMERRFSGIGDVENTVIRAVGENYVLMDRVYDMGMQTFIATATEAAETLLPKLCNRQKYLARALMEDMEDGQKILVYKMTEIMTADEIQRLWRAIRAYGDSALLIVRLADEEHPVGSLKILEDGLMLGAIDRFSNIDISVDNWTKVCTAARDAWAAAKAAPDGTAA